MVKTRSGADTHCLDINLDLNTNSEDNIRISVAPSPALNWIPTTMAASQGNDSKQNFVDLPAEPPAWFTVVSKRLDAIDNLNEKITSMLDKFKTLETDLSTVKESMEFACKESSEAKESASAAQKNYQAIETENTNLKCEIALLKSKVTQQESQSRRNNLLFNGIVEKDNESWEDCENSICNVIKNTMGVVTVPKFDRVHRIGNKIPGRNRTIIAKFCFFKERDIVWGQRKKLAKTGFRISEDFPIEIVEERKVLYPIWKAAINCPTVKTAYLKVNKLQINGKLYSTKNLKDLPPQLQPTNFSTKRENGVVLFSSKNSVLSNFYSEQPITIEDKTYYSTEQYYQATKAKFFNDELSYNKIMAESDPLKIYSIGKRISNCDEAVWDAKADTVLYDANIAKFKQISAAQEFLLGTDDDLIGEATTHPTFGIGRHISDPMALIETEWTGKNRFGKVLEKIRTELRQSEIVKK